MTGSRILRRLIGGKRKWILFPLVVGIGVMFYWPGSRFIEGDIFIPVQIAKLPAGMIHNGINPKGVEFRLRANPDMIQKLKSENLKYIVDLPDAREGVVTVPIEMNRVPFPGNVEVLHVSPSFMTLQVEREMVKTLPVSVVFSGEPASGFYVAGIQPDPLEMTLKGPRSLLAPHQKVFTHPVDLTAVAETFKKQVTLNLPENLRVVSGKEIVTVEIRIQEEMASKTIENIPIDVRGACKTFRLDPPTMDIEVKAPVHELQKVKVGKDIVVSVDLTGMKPGTHTVRASINLPVDFALAGASPEYFQVTIDP